MDGKFLSEMNNTQNMKILFDLFYSKFFLKYDENQIFIESFSRLYAIAFIYKHNNWIFWKER